MPPSDMFIRPMQAAEKPAVHAIMRRSFPLIEQWFFSWTPHVLVAEQEGKLLGAIVLKVFTLPHHRKGGLACWVFTAPEARGLQVGQRLTEAGLGFLQEQGCDEILACIEGYNTSSSNIFATRGFGILSPGEQFRRYGLSILAVWYRIFHVIDIGHFVWARPAAERPDSPALQWWGNALMNALIALLALWRRGGFLGIDPRAFLALPLSVLCFFGVRELLMRLAARLLKLPVRYRVWESGFPLSLLIALVGGWFPMPGNVYPSSDRWSYREVLPRLGTVALAGVLPGLILAWAAWALLRFGALPPAMAIWIRFARSIVEPLVLFDVALPFFPFVSFNGRRIWDWNRAAWIILAVAAVIIFFLA